MFRFAEFCRLCLTNTSLLVHIKTADEDELKLSDKITALNADLIPANDPLPKWICRDCQYRLNKSYTFQKKCLQSLNILTQCLSQIKRTNFGHHETKFYITNIETVDKKKQAPAKDPLDLDNDTTTSDPDPEILPIFDSTDLESSTFEMTDFTATDIERTIIKDEPSDENIDDVKPLLTQHNPTLDSILNEPTDNVLDSIEEKESAFEFDHFLTETPVVFESIENENNTNEKDFSVADPKNKGGFICYTIDHDLNFYFCKTCNRNFTSDKNLLIHISNHTKTPFKCEVCNKTFARNSILEKHKLEHEAENKYSCSVCPEVFYSQETFVSHLKTHLEPKDKSNKNICGICGKKFLSVSQLQLHLQSHDDMMIIKRGKRNSTPNCEDDFINLLSCQSNRKENLECTDCNMKFNNEKRLNLHKRMHIGKTQYSCDTCGKKFAQKISLLAHKRSHSKRNKEISTESTD